MNKNCHLQMGLYVRLYKKIYNCFDRTESVCNKSRYGLNSGSWSALVPRLWNARSSFTMVDFKGYYGVIKFIPLQGAVYNEKCLPADNKSTMLENVVRCASVSRKCEWGHKGKAKLSGIKNHSFPEKFSNFKYVQAYEYLMCTNFITAQSKFLNRA